MNQSVQTVHTVVGRNSLPSRWAGKTCPKERLYTVIRQLFQPQLEPLMATDQKLYLLFTERSFFLTSQLCVQYLTKFYSYYFLTGHIDVVGAGNCEKLNSNLFIYYALFYIRTCRFGVEAGSS